MPTWIFIALLAGIGSNLSAFLFRYLLKDGEDASSYAWFHEAFRLIFFGIIAFFDFRLSSDFKGIFYLSLLGICEFFAIYLIMKMHSYSHLSISTIISRTRLIWVPLIALVLFGDRLSAIEYAGIAILFLGLSIASSPRKLLADKGLKFAYMSAFMVAVVNIQLKLVAPYASTSLVMIFMALPSVFLFPLIMKGGYKRITASLSTQVPLKMLAGFVTALSTYLIAYAIGKGNVSIASALYQSMMIVSVIAGIVFLHERENMGKKIVGSIISLFGIYLLTVL